MTTETVQGAHLVGSVPLTDARDVFRTAGELMGGLLRRIPDGETGDRTEWVHFQLPVLSATPGLHRADVEIPGLGTIPRFTVDPGVEAGDIAFGDIGYARVALRSYEDFRAARSAGEVPPDARFQVSLPTPAATIATWIDPAIRADLEAPYRQALLGELDRICAGIPHEELAIQWDTCIEVLMVEAVPGFEPWFDDVWGGVLERMAPLAAAVPEDVEVGFHLCYGDYKHTHQVELVDATDLVGLANALVEASPRTVNWIHLPIPRDRDIRTYVAPLAGLDLPEATELYLGLVHFTDGLDGARARVAAAREVVERFGVATECGFGRRPPETVRPLMELHAAVSAPRDADERRAAVP